MVYLIILLAIALVIGPVMWMRPSAGQNRQARMRLKGRALGLDIRVVELPQTHRASVRREDGRQGAMYRIPVFDPRTVVAVTHRSVREPGATDWETAGDALPAQLQACLERVRAALPADAVAVEIGPQGPGICWSERGEEAAVELIAAQLKELRSAMAIGRGL